MNDSSRRRCTTLSAEGKATTAGRRDRERKRRPAPAAQARIRARRRRAIAVTARTGEGTGAVDGDLREARAVEGALDESGAAVEAEVSPQVRQQGQLCLPCGHCGGFGIREDHVGGECSNYVPRESLLS